MQENRKEFDNTEHTLVIEGRNAVLEAFRSGKPIDVYGQNIYNGRAFRMGADGNPEEVGRVPGAGKTAVNWPVTPECLYWGPKFLYERYKKPIYITENGMACHDVVSLDQRVHDPNRIDFLAIIRQRDPDESCALVALLRRCHIQAFIACQFQCYVSYQFHCSPQHRPPLHHLSSDCSHKASVLTAFSSHISSKPSYFFRADNSLSIRSSCGFAPPYSTEQFSFTI